LFVDLSQRTRHQERQDLRQASRAFDFEELTGEPGSWRSEMVEPSRKLKQATGSEELPGIGGIDTNAKAHEGTSSVLDGA
jgi:hypothetical protein